MKASELNEFQIINIQPASGGFGMWQTGNFDPEIYDNLECLSHDEIFELGEDELPEGIDDIRGNVYNEPAVIFAAIERNAGIDYNTGKQIDYITYFGINPVKK